MTRRALWLIAVIVALGLAHPTRVRTAGPYIPYHGMYWLTAQPSGIADRFEWMKQASGRVNFTEIPVGSLVDIPFLRQLHLQAVDFSIQVLGDALSPEVPFADLVNDKKKAGETVGAWSRALAKIQSDLQTAELSVPGISNRFKALSLGEELYGSLGCTSCEYDNPNSYPTMAGLASLAPKVRKRFRADALTALLNQRYAEAKGVFPGVYTMQVEGSWSAVVDLLDNAFYAPPPATLEVLGLDPYFPGNVSDCGPSTKAQWDGYTGAIVNHALQSFPAKPIALVGQAFRHTPGNGWPAAPAPCQLEWWYQLAAINAARIPLLMWFNYGYTDDSIPRGVRAPEHAAQLIKIIEIFDRNLANKP